MKAAYKIIIKLADGSCRRYHAAFFVRVGDC